MHPKVVEKYLEAGYEQDKETGKLIGVLESASDVNERAFWVQANSAKQPIKKEITKVIRLKKQGKEYFYYHESLSSRNYLGNKIHYYHTVGFYKDPQFNRVADAKTGRVTVTDIESEEDVYEFEWPKDWTSELEALVSENVDLLVATPSRKYGGFSLDDFKEKSFDDLVTLGKYGTVNPVVINELKKKNARNA